MLKIRPKFEGVSGIDFLPKSASTPNCRFQQDIQNKNPKSIQKMGFYNSTMALSTGVYRWLKCEQYTFEYQT
jgi:hypothetical protein